MTPTEFDRPEPKPDRAGIFRAAHTPLIKIPQRQKSKQTFKCQKYLHFLSVNYLTMQIMRI